MTSNDTRNHIIHTRTDLIGQKGFGAYTAEEARKRIGTGREYCAAD